MNANQVYGAVVVSTMLLFSGCGKSETTAKQGPAPTICFGTFVGKTPAYSMRDGDGELIRINGNTIDVPAIDNTLVVSKDTVTLTQEADGKNVNGEGRLRLIRADSNEVLIETAIVQGPDTRPTYRIRYDLANDSVTLLQIGPKGKTPETLLRRVASK